MKRSVVVLLIVSFFAAVPCQAQFMKTLKDSLIGSQQQQQMAAQPTLIGNVNLPPGDYMMTNVQSGQAFYVAVQNGQMYLTNQQVQTQQNQPIYQPGQSAGQTGKGILQNLIRNQLTPQTQQQQVPYQQY
ncbi:MAG: hypothetical protein H6677_16790 [Candidatus Obscuribacterales bacterium]|nr:hypothetical protein [Cyanobacteria bacterium HKST-UBA01]MCB9469930.1 hypothetical protein [Candidatus Obscuribacterales bacterium]